MSTELGEFQIIDLNHGDLKELFSIEYHGGGAKDLYIEALVFSRLNIGNTFFYLDGDQKKVEFIPDNGDISDSQAIGLMEEITGIRANKFQFACDGNSPEQKIEEVRAFIQFMKNNFFYFPGTDPEDTIWDASTLDTNYTKDVSDDYKECIRKWTEKELEESNSNHIKTYRARLLKKIDIEHENVQEINRNVDFILSQTEAE